MTATTRLIQSDSHTHKRSAAPASSGAGTKVVAPLNGVINRILVNVGDQVAVDQVVFVVEAMKMEIEVKSPAAGTVSAIIASKGANVVNGQDVLTLN